MLVAKHNFKLLSANLIRLRPVLIILPVRIYIIVENYLVISDSLMILLTSSITMLLTYTR